VQGFDPGEPVLPALPLSLRMPAKHVKKITVQQRYVKSLVFIFFISKVLALKKLERIINLFSVFKHCYFIIIVITRIKQKIKESFLFHEVLKELQQALEY
jgi:hypothetical protein